MFKFYLFQEHIAIYTKACNLLQALFIMKNNCQNTLVLFLARANLMPNLQLKGYVLEWFSIQNSLRWMVNPSNFQWKKQLEGKSIHSEIVKLEDFSFQ